MVKKEPVIFKSLAQLHRAMGQPAPLHPLISIINYGAAVFDPKDFEQGIISRSLELRKKYHKLEQ